MLLFEGQKSELTVLWQEIGKQTGKGRFEVLCFTKKWLARGLHYICDYARVYRNKCLSLISCNT